MKTRIILVAVALLGVSACRPSSTPWDRATPAEKKRLAESLGRPEMDLKKGVNPYFQSSDKRLKPAPVGVERY